MTYDYGYLTAVGGGMWVVFPKGGDPETSYIFGSVSSDEAEKYCTRLNSERM